jgi:hypothetical protein
MSDCLADRGVSSSHKKHNSIEQRPYFYGLFNEDLNDPEKNNIVSH